MRETTSTSREVHDLEEARLIIQKEGDRLQQSGVSRAALARFVLQVPFRYTQSRKRDWDKPPIPLHKLKRYPARLKRVAGEINEFYRYALFHPAKFLRDNPKERGRNLAEELRSGVIETAALANKLQDLPNTLREYAEFLSACVRGIGKVRRHPYNPFHHYLVAFTEYVHAKTGFFLYAEVANLATALISTTGSRLVLDPVNLAKLYQKNTHLRTASIFE